MADYGSQTIVKRKLNLNTGSTEADDTIDDALEEADEFINTRVTLLNGSAPLVGDASLNALGSAYAAAIYNYLTSPSKPMDGMKHYESKIINHLKAKFTGTMEDEITQDTFSKSASRTLGTE